MITVRPIAAGDVESLARNVKPEPLLHEARAQLQRDGEALYLVALDDGRAVGHALLQFPPLGLEDVPEVEDLFVAPRSRSHGIGTQLLEEAERAARGRGYDGIGLAVGVENAGAQRLYARAGYADSGRGEFWLEGAHETCRYLVKAL